MRERVRLGWTGKFKAATMDEESRNVAPETWNTRRSLSRDPQVLDVQGVLFGCMYGGLLGWHRSFGHVVEEIGLPGSAWDYRLLYYCRPMVYRTLFE